MDEACVAEFEKPVMGGEDFSYYCQEVPSCFFALGLLPAGQDVIPSLHQPTFDFNDDAIATGIKIFLRSCVAITIRLKLEKHENQSSRHSE